MIGTILSIIVGIITLAVMIIQGKAAKAVTRKAEQDAKDKEIDAAKDADDIMRASGGMR